MNVKNLLMALFLTIVVMGCTHKNKPSDEYTHDEKLQLYSYNDNFEVFLEATPFTEGQESDILIYVTCLENFKPLANGKITVSLIVGIEGIRQSVEKSLKEGVYKFHLKPSASGVGKLLVDIKTTKGEISQLIIPNITVYNDLHEAQHAASDALLTSGNAVGLGKEQSWKIDFATEKVKQEAFGQVIHTIAQILPSQGDERVIIAKADGIISFVGNNVVSEGQNVRVGETLFSIEGGGMLNNVAVIYSEGEMEYKRTKAEYERKKELVKEKIVSESELLKAQTEFTNAENRYNNLRKNFSTGKQSVSSPINGFISQIMVSNGQYVEAGIPIMVVSQNRELLMKAELQPKYFSLLNRIISANIKVLDNREMFTLEELEGKVISFGKSTDVNNPLIPVVFQVKNTVGLLSGSFVEMYIKTQSNNQVLTVPNESILEEMGTYFVYSQLTPILFEKRAIKKGATDGIRTEIIEGVTSDERVVTKGAVLLKLAQTSGEIDAHSGHVH